MEESSLTEVDGELDTQQVNQLTQFKRWAMDMAPFCGRTDDDFLLLFLRGCKFEVARAEQKMIKYYDNRRKLSVWWSDRDVTHPTIQKILHLKPSFLTTEAASDGCRPALIVTRLASLESLSGDFDGVCKFHSMLVELSMRRRSCQLHGVVLLVDCDDYPLWLARRVLRPTTARNIVSSYYQAIPIQFKKVLLVNTPPVALTFYHLIKPWLSSKLTQRFIFFGSDWSKLSDHVPKDVLPEEYGGLAGPIQQHQEAFVQEMTEFNDYLQEDAKYGFITRP